MNNFTQIPFIRENLDLYYIRTSIFEAIKKNSQYFKGDFLDVGCGKMPYKKYILENSDVKKYIGLDIESALDYGDEKPDYIWNGEKCPLGIVALIRFLQPKYLNMSRI